VGILAALDVRRRLAEVAVLRALGHTSGAVATLFLGKAAVAGVAGALLGWGAGTSLALAFAPGIFELTAGSVEADPRVLGWSLLGAPLFAALASFVPSMMAVAQDPAAVLGRE
jgi:ABC-type lipoprotein release transport system permease subunit